MNSRITGITLVIIGIAIFVLRFVDIHVWGIAWPIFVIAPGLGLLYFAFAGERAQLGLAIPGAVVTGTGLILAALNLSGHWEAWAYLWTLYPAFVGLAMYQVGQRNAEPQLQAAGRRTGISGLYALVSFGLFFELLVFSGSFSIFNGSFLPFLLIAIGSYIIFVRGYGSQCAVGKSKQKVDVY
jgi:hypothetical protein